MMALYRSTGCEIPSYQTLQYVEIRLKHKTPDKD